MRTSNMATTPELPDQNEQSTREWVEAILVPILRDLSRRGVIIIYDARVEKTARGTTDEFSIGI